MKRKIVFVGLLLLVVVFCFPHEEVKSLTLPAAGVETLMIDCGAGFLEVEGREGQDTIEASAEIVLKGRSEKQVQEFIRKNVNLSLEQKGSRAILISNIKQKFSLFSWKTAVINLTVFVPKNIGLNIDDGSGWIKVGNTGGEVFIDDGSGKLEIANVTGGVEIDDGSGEIRVTGVKGAVRIEDGSGDVKVEDVSGDVYIDDSSGAVRVHSVVGSVTVSDSSGSIYVEQVEGDFVLKDDGSGSVHLKDIKGRVKK